MGQTKRRILFLDDRSKRIHAAFARWGGKEDLTIVTTVIEFLHYLSTENYDEIYLDYDLGGQEFVDPASPFCSMEIIRYIEKTAWPPDKFKPHIIIHSSNVFAAAAMKSRLEDLGFWVTCERFQYDSTL